MRQRELLIYRMENTDGGDLLEDVAKLFTAAPKAAPEDSDTERIQELFFDCAHRLLELAGRLELLV